MRKLSSKIVAAILAGTMVLGMIGCGNTTTSKEESKVTSESKKEESKTSESAESKVEEVVEEVLPGAGEIVYPLGTDDQLTVWSSTVKPPSSYTSYTEWPFYQNLSEATGIDFELKYPAEGTDGTQAYNLMLTQKVLPDIIMAWIGHGDAETMIEEGVIYDLTEYIPKYAPDYWKWVNDHDLLTAIKSSSGKIYGMHSFAENEFVACYTGPIIRRDWLDECNLEVPVTLADWENVLTVFKEKYNATFSSTLSDFAVHGLAAGTGAYLTVRGYGEGYYLDDAGKVQYAPVQPEYKEYLETLNRWYDKGLINKDFFTEDRNTLRSKVLNGEVGVTFTAMSQLTNYIVDAEAEKTGAIFEGFGYPRVSEDEPSCWIQTTADDFYGFVSVVTTSCPEEKLITALQFLNYGYTEEGMRTWQYGKEGETYTVDANGDIQWTELVTGDPDGLNQAVKKYNTSAGQGATVKLARVVQLKNSPECTVAVNTWLDNQDARKHYIPTGAAMTPDEQAEYSDKDQALSTNAGEMALKFISGEVSFDEWDAFVETQKNLGYERTVELRQAAYDRYASK